MIVTVKIGWDARSVERELAARGQWVQRHEDGARTLLLLAPSSAAVDADALRAIAGVESVACRPSPHPLLDAQGSERIVCGARFAAGAQPVLMAGPCSVESAAQIESLAAELSSLGVRFLRGGAYKPRTSPHAFQGHGAPALAWLRRAADAHGLGVVTEAMSPADAPLVAEVADLVQVGSRNMQSYALLRAVGATGRPALLKRGAAATVEEWLLAAEHLRAAGSPFVILAERGVRGFDPSTRNLLDLGAVALLAHAHHLPVVVDPSHATGRRDLVAPLARAGLAAGACGLLIETHADPGHALSDGPQALLPAELAALARSISVVADERAPARQRRTA